jgi:CRISPR-associated protein Cmr4
MHAGSGDANYGVIDKLVQRDPVTGYPTVHPSSLKGALREHFEQQPGWEKGGANINKIFGKEAVGGTDSESGEYKFLGADLISLPVRCNFEQYVLGINKVQLDLINIKSELLTNKKMFKVPDNGNNLYYKINEPAYELYAEDIKIENNNKVAHLPLLNCATELKCFDKKYASFNDSSFKTISESLPVIARNYIEDGTSENLWYEQVVPHQSVFITFIGMTETLKTEFENVLKEGIVQIGGNATIGYGLCKFYKIDLKP